MNAENLVVVRNRPIVFRKKFLNNNLRNQIAVILFARGRIIINIEPFAQYFAIQEG